MNDEELQNTRNRYRDSFPNDEAMQAWEEIVQILEQSHEQMWLVLTGTKYAVKINKYALMNLDRKFWEWRRTLEREQERQREPIPALPNFCESLHGLLQKAIADALTPDFQKLMTSFPHRQLDRDDFLRKAADNVLGALHHHKDKALEAAVESKNVDESSLDYRAYLLWLAASEPKGDRSDYRVLAKSMIVREGALRAICQCFY